MVDAKLTAKCRFYIGNETWLGDLTSYANSVDSVGSTNIEKLTVLESAGVESLVNNEQINFNIPTLYYGDISEDLADHRQEKNTAIIIMEDTEDFYLMPVIFPGLPISNPTNSVIQHNISFLQNGIRIDGCRVSGKDRIKDLTKINDSANAVITANGTTTFTDDAGDHVYFIATKLSASASVKLNIDGITNPVKKTVDNVGVYYIGETTSTTTGLVASDISSGSPSIEGFICIGPEAGLD